MTYTKRELEIIDYVVRKGGYGFDPTDNDLNIMVDLLYKWGYREIKPSRFIFDFREKAKEVIGFEDSSYSF